MRFDEFLERNGVSFTPVSHYDGYLVQVAVPPDWEEAIDTSSSATPVWIWRDGNGREPFCANAVLTLAQTDAPMDPAAAFAKLCEWQVQMLPGVHEMRRDPAVGHAGPGVMGILELLINTDVGRLESMVMSCIIATDAYTLIAQLTLTVPIDSALERSRVGLGVIPSSEAPLASQQLPGAPAAPGAATVEVH